MHSFKTHVSSYDFKGWNFNGPDLVFVAVSIPLTQLLSAVAFPQSLVKSFLYVSTMKHGLTPDYYMPASSLVGRNARTGFFLHEAHV